MIQFDISVGKSRLDKHWKVVHYEWKQFVFKLSKTHRTPESFADYLAATPDRQAEIKDLGGYVGGVIVGGRRKKGSILSRGLLVLECDLAKPDLWDDFELLFPGIAAALHTTHKHSPEKPRFRILIPLAREVPGDEYEALGRMIAGKLGIDQFDETGFQFERLMYWPSTSADGEYLFKEQEGPALDPDKILGMYKDWRDIRTWPAPAGVKKKLTSDVRKQEDPLSKPGVIGAFCRAYSIEEAIDTFLPSDYVAADLEGRYTYTHGSTSGGLVTYESKFAFSHHNTDPASGVLCNAFDLVRIHKFGTKDADYEQEIGKNGTHPPSFKLMMDFAVNDKLVRAQQGADLLERAKIEFDEFTEAALPADTETAWAEKLEIDKQGNPKNTLDNIRLILKNDEVLKGKIGYDELEHSGVFFDNMPWRKVTHATRYMTDNDLAFIQHRLEVRYRLQTQRLPTAMLMLFEKTKFHPVKQYLSKLSWDGKPRIEKLLIEYMGVEPSEYVAAVTRLTLVAAVARAFDPGCKYEYILTLVGAQGSKKSTFFDKLAGAWFSDTFSFHMLKGKEGFEQLRGAWIIEISELAGMTKTEIEAIKSFVASRTDRFRPAFGHTVERFPRGNIFVASTNKTDFLRDQSGNRRFWPVVVSKDKATKEVFSELPKEVDQIWAEATAAYFDGVDLYLDEDLEKTAGEIQKEHTETHPWFYMIQEFLKVRLPEKWSKMNRWERLSFLQNEDGMSAGIQERDRVCILEIWNECLNQKAVIDERNAAIIKSILLNTPGWEIEKEPKKFGIYGLQRNGFVKNSENPFSL